MVINLHKINRIGVIRKTNGYWTSNDNMQHEDNCRHTVAGEGREGRPSAGEGRPSNSICNTSLCTRSRLTLLTLRLRVGRPILLPLRLRVGRPMLLARCKSASRLVNFKRVPSDMLFMHAYISNLIVSGITILGLARGTVSLQSA